MHDPDRSRDLAQMFEDWDKQVTRLPPGELAELDQAVAHYKDDMRSWGITLDKNSSAVLGYTTALFATIMTHYIKHCTAQGDAICPNCVLLAMDEFMQTFRVLGSAASSIHRFDMGG